MKKSKQIGWVVEFNSEGQWYPELRSARYTRTEAMIYFDYYIVERKGIKITSYKKLRRRGLARCVPVYVESTP